MNVFLALAVLYNTAVSVWMLIEIRNILAQIRNKVNQL